MAPQFGLRHEAKCLEKMFFRIGFTIGSYPKLFIALSLVFIGSLSSGLTHLNVVQNPQAIWVPPGSATAQQQKYFGNAFEPFFRIEQAIFMKKGAAAHEAVGTEQLHGETVAADGTLQVAAGNASSTCQVGNVITIASFQEMLRIQTAITNLADSAGT